ncbi:MAG TPA: adenosylcobinamide-GDP ribazoletransferase, partial [Chloroflexota bacterium]|nr:adenosylcobinamide-GDP ribazoletransferase [Chloroflexota bacterium]
MSEPPLMTTGMLSGPDAAAERTPWWAPLALSWSFLTVLPVPPVPVTPAALALASGWFPLVGALLGVALGGLGLLLDRLLPPGPTAVVLLAAG